MTIRKENSRKTFVTGREITERKRNRNKMPQKDESQKARVTERTSDESEEESRGTTLELSQSVFEGNLA